MRVAIVHHWLITLGGGERVLETLAAMFPAADIFVLLADPHSIPSTLRGRRIHESFLARIPAAHRIHRHLLPLYPLAVEQLDLRGYDLVITSDAGPMKGVIVAPGAMHICYCHAPMRYLWNQFHEYQEPLSGIAKCAFSVAAHYVRGWDFAAAQRVTLFVANSQNVSNRIRQYYGRSSVVLYPPVNTSSAQFVPNPQDSYLAVGRLVAYKRMDLVINACNRLKRRLRIIGSGPEERNLRALAGPTIEFLGHANDADLWREYARCRALLFAAEDDFGIAPVEAQACGRPVIAYGKGGALESVATTPGSNGHETGVFFYQQNALSLADAILEFERKEQQFQPLSISAWAEQFSAPYFVDGFHKIVNNLIRSEGQSSAIDYEAESAYAPSGRVASIRRRSAH